MLFVGCTDEFCRIVASEMKIIPPVFRRIAIVNVLATVSPSSSQSCPFICIDVCRLSYQRMLE